MQAQSVAALIRTARCTVTNWRPLWSKLQKVAESALPMTTWLADVWSPVHWQPPPCVQELARADSGFSGAPSLRSAIAVALGAPGEAQ
eukprot:1651639-Pyramimonas_sp.AAC.1